MPAPLALARAVHAGLTSHASHDSRPVLERYDPDGFYCELLRSRASGSTLDARHDVPRIDRILMARGRDATDVAISTSSGPSRLADFTVITDEILPDRTRLAGD